MSYSLDFRQKVINFAENGGKITKAAHTFGIGRASIYRWLSRPNVPNNVSVLFKITILFMTIAIVLVPVKPLVSTSIVTTQTVLG